MNAQDMNDLTYDETNELIDNPNLEFIHEGIHYDAEYIGYEGDVMQFRLVEIKS